MHILNPEIVPDTEVKKPADLRAAAEAMFASADFFETFGDPPPPTEDDKEAARKVILEEKPVSAIRTSAAADHLKLLLSEYDREIVHKAVQIRHFVINRLIEEAQPGSRQAVRALELLGKVTGVDLFTERTEVTVKNQTQAELVQVLRDKIDKLKARKHEAIDVVPRADPALVARQALAELVDSDDD